MRMRLLPVSVFAVFAGLAILPAVGGPPGDQDRPRKADRQAKLLQRFDANGNGQIDPDEKEAAKRAMAKRREQGAAADGPGAGGEGKGKPDPERMKKLLERFDSNKDGKLDEIEKAAAKEARQKFQADRR